jgi:glycosyltransferase involved in cell wall biosynthesis
MDPGVRPRAAGCLSWFLCRGFFVMSESLPAAADPAPEAAPPGRPLVTHFLYGYRQEPIVRAAIASVLAQTYQPLEIVLSDDCSPDGTFQAMQEMAAAYRGPHRIILNRNPTNLGHARHVERIMEISSGAFVVESAGDDISLPERTERLVEAWLASGRRAHVVHSEKQDIDAAGARMDFVPRSDVLADITPRQKLQRRHDLIGATMGWSREVYDRFGPISDLAAFQDYPIAFRALLLGEVRFLPEPLVLYRVGGASQKQAASCGDWYFYGDRIRYMRWDLEFFRCYRRDLDRLPPPDHAACAALCDAFVREAEFTIALADMTRRQRFRALPRAAGLSLRHRDAFFLRMAVKYLLDRPFMRYLDWKTGQAPRQRRTGTAAAI